MRPTLIFLTVLSTLAFAIAQVAPYDQAPPVEPPYYRVRYEASTKPGELIFPVQYTVWIPEGVKTLRGRHRPPARMRRGFVQIGTDGSL
jgi:hypothetical protein